MSEIALDPTYDRVTKHVVSVMDANKVALNGSTQRQWFNFKNEEDSSEIPIYSPNYLTDTFDRDRLNKNISNLFTNDAESGSLGELTTNTVQVNKVAGWERDLSSRFKSRVRSLAHRASEVDAEGTNNSPLRSSIIKDMNTILETNAADPVDETIGTTEDDARILAGEPAATGGDIA